MINILFVSLLGLTTWFQSGNSIQIDQVTKGDSFSQGESTYHSIGKLKVEPFDIKDRDAYVLLLSNAGGKLVFHEFEKFAFNDVNRTSFNWSYSFNISTPKDDFNVYAILVDKFSDAYFNQFEKDVANMSSIEELIGVLRKTDRIDPLNFNIFWVRTS